MSKKQILPIYYILFPIYCLCAILALMTKSRQQVVDMLEVEGAHFKLFKEIHDKYMEDPKQWQEKFNEEGQKVMHIIKRWENNLCNKSESGKYGKFSSNLADKFWEEIRKVFPKIDYVGMNQPT